MNKKPRLLVHLHLYYHNQLDYFLKILKNINNCNWDLYVTMCENREHISEKISQFYPNAKIIQVSNIGYDVFPFINIIKSVDLKNYDYVLKLHTKAYRDVKGLILDRHPEFNSLNLVGFGWRNHLIKPLCGSKIRFRKNLKLFKKNPNLGIIADKTFRLNISESFPEDIEGVENLKKLLKIESKNDYFCAGTMFLIRANLLEKIKTAEIDSKDFAKNSQSKTSSTLAHFMERIFVQLADSENYETLFVKDYIQDIIDNCYLWLKKNYHVARYFSKFLPLYYVFDEDFSDYEFVNRYTKNKKIILWGASEFLKKVLKNSPKNDNIIGIVDKNPEVWGKTIEHYTIFSPEEIKNLHPDCILVTVIHHNSKVYSSVKTWLKENKIKTKLLPNLFWED